MGARNPFQAREVTSRRGGPAKPPLSRDAIVGAALELLTREGLDGMTMRKVAAALDTGPASLYAYIDGLEDLRALVCDRGLAEVKTTGSSKRDWRERLLALLESYQHALEKRPGLAQLALSTIAAGPNALRILEALLGLLEEAGVDRATAAWAVDLLTLHVTAVAAERSLRDGQPAPLGPIGRAIDAVAPAEHPRIHAAREELMSDGARSAWALQVLLTGILQTPVRARRARR